MMDNNETLVWLNLSTETRGALLRLAVKEDMSLSEYIRGVLVDHIVENNRLTDTQKQASAKNRAKEVR